MNGDSLHEELNRFLNVGSLLCDIVIHRCGGFKREFSPGHDDAVVNCGGGGAVVDQGGGWWMLV